PRDARVLLAGRCLLRHRGTPPPGAFARRGVRAHPRRARPPGDGGLRHHERGRDQSLTRRATTGSVHHGRTAVMDRNRPRIGITTSPKRGSEYYNTYKRAVEAAGAEAVDLPPRTRAIGDLDGPLLPGGWDVDPALYGEKPDSKVGDIDPELDETELRLFKQAHDQQLPVLGICRGQQVINVAMGGSLVQHLEGHEVRTFGRKHLAHTAEVDPASELGRAVGGT